MELYDFNRESISQRAVAVWEHGTFLAIRRSRDCQLILYHMGPFFAEVWYQVEANKLEMVLGFKTKARLDPYLEQVDLSGLLVE
jgi:hypothetical protein